MQQVLCFQQQCAQRNTNVALRMPNKNTYNKTVASKPGTRSRTCEEIDRSAVIMAAYTCRNMQKRVNMVGKRNTIPRTAGHGHHNGVGNQWAAAFGALSCQQ
jgi:hypothetical protein